MTRVMGPVSHEIQGTDGLRGIFMLIDCQSSILWTWCNSQQKPSLHSYLAVIAQPCPLGIRQDYTMNEATILSWPWKLLRWNQLVYIFLNTSTTNSSLWERTLFKKVFQLEGSGCLYMPRGALWLMVAVLSDSECLLGVFPF